MGERGTSAWVWGRGCGASLLSVGVGDVGGVGEGVGEGGVGDGGVHGVSAGVGEGAPS